MFICNTGNQTSFVQVNDGTVITLAPICKKKIREIGRPLTIYFLGREVLIKLVFRECEAFSVNDVMKGLL